MLDTLLGLCRADGSGWVNKDPADDYWYGPRGIETISSADISEDSAFRITTVFACVAKISKTIASLPVDVVEKTGPRERAPVEHPLEDLLDGEANGDASGMTLREAMQANLELWGSAYVFVDWSVGRRNEPYRLTLIPSREIVDIKRDNETGSLLFIHRDGGRRDAIKAADMWYTPALSINGVTGVSTVGYNREALGLARATSDFGNAFFGNGAWAGGFIQQPLEAPPLSETAGQALVDGINEKFRGARKAFGFGLLREGLEFKQIDMPFEDAMFLSTREFQRIEICGMFDMPPTMIHDNTHSTYSNSEQADIAFQKHSIAPRVVRIERSARRRFFIGTKLYLKHNMAGLLRGDFATQSNGFALGRQWGWFSANDVREAIDRNPIKGGDTYLEPLNMIPVGQTQPVPAGPSGMVPSFEPIAVAHSFPAAAIPAPEAPASSPTPDAMAIVLPAIEHAADRIASRQCRAIQSAWKKHARDGRRDTFEAWVDKFFVQHAEITGAELEPAFLSWEAASCEPPMLAASVVAGNMSRHWQAAVATAFESPMGVPVLIDEWKHGLASEIVGGVCRILEPEDEEPFDENEERVR
ncbi:MAG TPA: phage portal protein [Thermoguttaceae bacterium]|nr:phage portal protein [Thermoguttaceae bacterium]